MTTSRFCIWLAMTLINSNNGNNISRRPCNFMNGFQILKIFWQKIKINWRSNILLNLMKLFSLQINILWLKKLKSNSFLKKLQLSMTRSSISWSFRSYYDTKVSLAALETKNLRPLKVALRESKDPWALLQVNLSPRTRGSRKSSKWFSMAS